MPTDTLTIRKWFDRHLHLRDEEMLEIVLPYTLRSQAAGAVIMGNLPHPFQTSRIDRAITYRGEIEALLPNKNCFNPVMTCYLTDETTPETVVRGYNEGVWRAVKLYLAGKAGTTNSNHGVKDLRNRYPVFAAMEKSGIPLLGHFESTDPETDEFDREIVSIYLHLEPIIKAFPGLKIVFEHITDGRSADFVAAAGENIYATVTAHHLMINRNAMFMGGMQPIHYCKPVPKREEHRIKIRQYVTSGHPRFGAGTDSAPHPQAAKVKPSGCAAGIFTAPAAPELYATVFDEENSLHHLEAFLSVNLLHLYGQKPSDETMTFERTPFTIPATVGLAFAIPVFKGSETIPWRLIGR